jgi:hypothetical protein
MIVAECHKLQKRIDEMKLLKELDRRTADFQTLAQRLQRAVAPFVPLGRTVALFRTPEREIGTPSLEHQAAAAREMVLRARQLLQAGPERLLDRGAFRLGEFSDTVRGLEDDLRSQLRQLWQNYTRPHVLELDLGVLEVLEQIPSLRASVQIVRTRLNDVSQLRNALPETEDAIRKFHEAAQRLKQAWAKLGGKDIPPELLAFIKEAAGGHFPLGYFSDSLRQQLQQRDWLKYFVVGIHRADRHGPL